MAEGEWVVGNETRAITEEADHCCTYILCHYHIYTHTIAV